MVVCWPTKSCKDSLA